MHEYAAKHFDEVGNKLAAVTAQRDELLAVLEDAVPFLQDHAEEMKDLAASWPENPDGDGAAATAQARVDRARAVIAKAKGATAENLLSELKTAIAAKGAK